MSYALRLLVALVLAAGSQAHAAVVTQVFTFEAGDFSCFTGSVEPCTPVDSVSGSFTVTYDDALDSPGDGLAPDAFSLVINDAIYDETSVLFNYRLVRPFLWDAPSISLYAPITGGSVDFGTDDFALTFQIAPDIDRIVFSYSSLGADDIYQAGPFTPGSFANVTLVPVPPALALFASACALLCGLRARRG